LDAKPANKTNQGVDLQPIPDASPASKTEQPVKLMEVWTLDQKNNQDLWLAHNCSF